MEEKDLKNSSGEEEVTPEEGAKAAAVEGEAISEEEQAATTESENSESESDKPDKKDLAIAELTDKLQRSMAEFDNFRKRSEKEKSSMFDLGAKSIAEKILPIVDNFERALQAAPVDGEGKAFSDGVLMIYNQMVKTLEELGVKAIECVGKPFDPNLHNAVMHVEDENFGENEVIEELLKGYMYKDSVLRHSMVKVAN